MEIILSDEQCLQWIKDPSISPYINNYRYLKDGIHFERFNRKQVLTNDKTLNNPRIFINKIKNSCFYNTALRQKIIDTINEYTDNKIPRLYTLNDKWAYASEEMKTPDPEFAKIDYTMPYYTIEQCMRWVNNDLIDPRKNVSLEQNSRIYIELLYTTMQYEIDITSLETNLRKKSRKQRYRTNNENTLEIIEGITKRLKYMKENDKYFLTHNITSFDDLLDVNALPNASSRKPKSNNTFGVSSLSSSSVKSLTPDEKIKLRDKTLMTDVGEKLEYEYTRQKKLKKKGQKQSDNNGNNRVFAIFLKFIEALNEEIWKDDDDQICNDILSGGINEEHMMEITKPIKEYYDNNRNGVYTEDLSNNIDNLFRIVRKFILNIYAQLLNPRYKLYTEIETFSYYNKLYDFEECLIIDRINTLLRQYLEDYRPTLKYDIFSYFLKLIYDVIPYNFVIHGSLNKPEINREKRKKLNNQDDDYENYYYKVLYANNKSKDSNIQYRLPVGKGFINGKALMRKFASIKSPNLFWYFNDDVAYKIFVTDDNNENDFTYEECKNWVMVPIINPRTFKRILIDSPIYNRLLCMTYQYDCNLIPRMITSRGSLIIDALKSVIKGILKQTGKPAQTREQLESYLIDRQFLKEKGRELLKLSPDIIGLKWKDYGGKKPRNRIDITAYSEALVSAFENKIKRDKIASRSSQDPVAFYVFFTKTEWAKFGITNLTKDSFIKVKAHYYIPVIDITPTIQVNKPAIERKSNYFASNPYNIVNYLRWVMQPNKDPKTEQIIATDSPTYNKIFENALMFDSNIQPINITANGLNFKKKILREKKKNLGIVSAVKAATSKGIKASNVSAAEKADIINKSEICTSINNIYTDNDTDAKYVDFKEKMLKMCYKYLDKRTNCNLAEIRGKIDDQFIKPNKIEAKEFVYYEGSALASIIVYYELNDIKNKIYNNGLQNNYINYYKKIFKVYINEIVEIDGELHQNEKRAVDLGGVSREFFTKLFEELFSNKENKKRPFILPEENSSSNRYYINPNFEPDEKFRNVIKFIRAYIQDIPEYNTEAEYVNIYNIIGNMLGIAIVNVDIGVPEQFSSYILSRFINPQKDINYKDILYFYLRDFNNSSTYMNMMNELQKSRIELCEFYFNDYYVISRPSESAPTGILLTKENYIKYILQFANHAVTKNFLFVDKEGSKKSMKKRYAALFAGFNDDLKTFFKKNDITIDVLDKLITTEKLDEQILLEFADKLKISVIKYVDDNIYAPRNNIQLTEGEKEALKIEIRTYMTNIITQKRRGENTEQHYYFIKRLLQFMSGFSFYNRHAEVDDNGYKFFYMYGANTGRFPSTHTCFYQLDFYGFPDNKITPNEREDYLYEKLVEAISNSKGMDIA
jgi:hypothetical protein